ncbi:unnamed protein product [Nippostrongylus brasiliensis]|uniref:Protein kinase domain-containing protein n=1 Tax=Nippostrongylus brasiliensis TaxID=27835 RepID=A0A0N4XGK7_NIPBR|nr:unnamed protein product [Nippostrongylus brasiliensis]
MRVIWGSERDGGVHFSPGRLGPPISTTWVVQSGPPISLKLCLWGFSGVLIMMVKSVFEMAAEYGSYRTPENPHRQNFSEIGDPDWVTQVAIWMVRDHPRGKRTADS